jgi:hypothetical protein
MTCTACGSSRVFPSRRRNIFERARHGLTGREPFRCHQCGLRTWRAAPVHDLHDDDHDTRPEDLRTGRSKAPVNPNEIDDLDAV